VSPALFPRCSTEHRSGLVRQNIVNLLLPGKEELGSTREERAAKSSEATRHTTLLSSKDSEIGALDAWIESLMLAKGAEEQRVHMLLLRSDNLRQEVSLGAFFLLKGVLMSFASIRRRMCICVMS
jgi:hypothetical protein